MTKVAIVILVAVAPMQLARVAWADDTVGKQAAKARLERGADRGLRDAGAGDQSPFPGHVPERLLDLDSLCAECVGERVERQLRIGYLLGVRGDDAELRSLRAVRMNTRQP